jgi:HlyD family secretion protein
MKELMKKKYLYIIIGILILGTAGYFLFFNSGPSDITYRTEKVTRGDILVQVRATGTINPVRTVQVGSQVSGIIEKIYVDFNSEVKKGDVIAQIDSTSLYAQVKQAEANVERNQAQVNDAKRTLTRTTELFKKNLVSQADLDVATTTYESSVAQLKQTQAALDQSRVNLRYAIIRAPIDGVVISRDVDVGQTVASSFQTPKLFSIANDLKRMQVEASVDEADIGQITTGDAVTFTVDAYPDEQFMGSVSQVRLSPITVQNVVTYTVIIDVPNPELKLRPGMTATVSILVDKRSDALRVPTLAIRFQPPQDVLDMSSEKQNKPEIKKNGEQTTTQKSPQSESRESKLNEFRQRRGKEGNTEMQARMEKMQGGELRESNKPKENTENKPYELSIASKTGRVWMLENGKKLKSVNVRTGINDNRFVEIVAGDLKEGDEVIIGAIGNNTASASTQQVNPFGPQRMMMGGGGGRDRR